MDDFRRKPLNRLHRPQLGDVQGKGADAPRPVLPAPMQPSQPSSLSSPEPQTTQEQVQLPQPPPEGLVAKKRKPSKIIIWSLIALVGVILVTLGIVWWWYQAQLAPVDSQKTEKVAVVIEAGSSPSMIAETLKDHEVIRSETAFLWYTRLSGVQNNLQAGTYQLASSESTPEIVDHMVQGRVNTLTITFLPGNTLAANRQVLLDAGYSASQVDAGFAKQYNSPLFEGKPANTDLEGYIYGETYTFSASATVEQVLEHTFEEYYSVIEENGLKAKLQKQGLSLFEGIILASIVQREASQKGDDMPQIAKVFYNRLAAGMPLGSDVTYQYIADKTNVQRDPNLDSPYNTRRYAGLPPGPISVPGLKALQATAEPAEGNFFYFLSGDDDITYFGRTFEEHEANIRNHCHVKCQIL